jgi:hypothetical protein
MFESPLGMRSMMLTRRGCFLLAVVPHLRFLYCNVCFLMFEFPLGVRSMMLTWIITPGNVCTQFWKNLFHACLLYVVVGLDAGRIHYYSQCKKLPPLVQTNEDFSLSFFLFRIDVACSHTREVCHCRNSSIMQRKLIDFNEIVLIETTSSWFGILQTIGVPSWRLVLDYDLMGCIAIQSSTMFPSCWFLLSNKPQW